jgi:hypothetical protein
MNSRPVLYLLPLLAAGSLLAQNGRSLLAQNAGPLPAQSAGPIRFDDATAQSGIDFTHSFGAEKLGSLLESTGAGCVWFDYNNDGKPDLFVVTRRR